MFHFKYTTAEFKSQIELLRELEGFCEYEKTEKFFLPKGGLHQHFFKHGGSLDLAKRNVESSVRRVKEHANDYSCSEMVSFFELIEKK